VISLISDHTDTAALVWEKADVSHTPLLAFHSAAAVDDHTIALFGGEGPDRQPQPELHLLNTGNVPSLQSLSALRF
jgi:hypothetical protein